MEEVFPVLAGIVIGLVAVAVPRSLRLAVVAVFGVAFGVVAAWISGELALSWLYALVDVAQAVGAAIGTRVLVAMWTRIRARAAAR
jgi:hypothetical protein